MRTLEDFVEDMITDGRTLKEIKYVSHMTQWKPKMQEVLEYAKKLMKKKKKQKSD